ncbi:MAG: branched-chain amino acid ABC transporter permease [Acidimicrobiia bacterium]|nr:branched-chain amino acid ABC transporter permease [Acidimicrobiia bacterium]
MAIKPAQLQTSYAQQLTFYDTPLQRVVVLVGVVLLLLWPLQTGTRVLGLICTIMLAIPSAHALNLLTGVAGLVSLGNAAFLAIGAFTAAALGSVNDLPFLPVVLISAVVAAAAGAIVGIPALRLRGLYLVVATMALHFIVIYAARRFQVPRVGAAGFRMPRPELFGQQMDQRKWYVVLTVIAVLSTVAFVNLKRSRFGRAWNMIRERDIAAEILGVNVPRYKILAFTLSSAMIGFQGAIFAYYLRTVEMETFNLNLAIDYVAIIIIGGLGSVHGAIFGAILVYGVPFYVSQLSGSLPRDSWLNELLGADIFNVNRIIYGLAIIGFLLFEPAGLAAIWARVRTWFSLWPFTRERR